MCGFDGLCVYVCLFRKSETVMCVVVYCIVLYGVCVVVVFVCGLSKPVRVIVRGLLCGVVWYVVCAVLCVFVCVCVVCVCDRACGGVRRVVVDCLCACELTLKTTCVCLRGI